MTTPTVRATPSDLAPPRAGTLGLPPHDRLPVVVSPHSFSREGFELVAQVRLPDGRPAVAVLEVSFYEGQPNDATVWIYTERHETGPLPSGPGGWSGERLPDGSMHWVNRSTVPMTSARDLYAAVEAVKGEAIDAHWDGLCEEYDSQPGERRLEAWLDSEGRI